MERVRAFFEKKTTEAEQHGVNKNRLCFDPGIGFGKTNEENFALIANPEKIRVPGTALLMAASRKRVIGAVCGNPPFEDRMAGTVAAHTASVLFGADMVRAHDTFEAVQAARVGEYKMETIRIKGLEIFAYHGVNPEEKENGQKFILDIAMQADISRAAQTDDLNETVNYAAVRKTVNAVFTAQKYDLIERAAQVVCDAILENYPKVQSVTVELKKPEAPINAVFDYVSVEMTRSRA